MTIGRQGLWACFLLAVQSQTNDSLSLSPSERTLPVAGQRLQKNTEPGGQRPAASVARSALVAAESLHASAVLACLPSFFSWGLNLTVKGVHPVRGLERKGTLAQVLSRIWLVSTLCPWPPWEPRSHSPTPCCSLRPSS